MQLLSWKTELRDSSKIVCEKKKRKGERGEREEKKKEK